MRNMVLIVLTLTLNFLSYAQNIKMSGLIIDSETKKFIEFVNIGVLNKNKGTVSNQNGEFNLEVSKGYIKDSLTISHINYYPVKIPIKNIKNQTIILKPNTTALTEVVVSSKKKKRKKIGVRSYNRLLSMRVISKKNDVIEAAQRINIPNEEVRVKAVNFNIRKWSEVDGVYVRINFYKNLNNTPGEKIVFKNIVQVIPSKTELGWINIDLSDYNILIAQDFFIGIEFIPNFKNATQVDLGGILSKGKGYIRENSLGSWEKLNGGASINVEIIY